MIKRVFTNETVLDVMHSIADAVHDVSPRAYRVMKETAKIRHEVYKRIIERDSRPLAETWHGKSLKKVYDK